MFQNFEVKARPEQGPPRLAALRTALKAAGVGGFLVPRADAYQGEYVAPCDSRLEWLTGFTGSAGFAAVLPKIAGVFVDGRYRLQARAQVDTDAFAQVDWPEVRLGDWLRDHARDGARIGFDPWLHTVEEIAQLRKALAGHADLVPLTENPIDEIWDDRPAPPQSAAFAYPEELAGRSASEKRESCAASLTQTGETAVILTQPDAICWLLNIRGADLPRIPVVQAMAVLHGSGQLDLFADPNKFEEVNLGPGVQLYPPHAFIPALNALDGGVRIDPKTAPQAVSDALAKPIHGPDPCALPRACKTHSEIEGARAAHLRDGAAVCEFLAWVDEQTPGAFTEIDVVRALEGFRRETGALRDISFETIAGAGPHGAIVHYRVTEETDRAVNAGELLLVDSGGQYLDGTTDITRTIAIGRPTHEMQVAYTRVLQGMIAISRARWPEGLSGRDLDPLARIHLWMAGQDYDHGTGHGVGAYLSVHEGPQRISRASEVPLRPGMIVSNEPGYYREGAFGIRIENLVVVEPAPVIDGADSKRRMLSFETLTWAPLDRRLILSDLLSRAEIAWIDSYHEQVRGKIGPSLGKRAQLWLNEASAPL
ncbi:Xaa-Pro aminopeptidase [Poseidonocella pacifica]|uniref:Xaa-Pro aminopeptidase n=1 Tax=Poseidonocella pacifica TaxID=871651 RepID=A0A1I0VUP3_9RHOB|nr:aminopeptidase P family protein [Poseidonocella pacifica]SFA80121.1 Xaa-Pro aminopeptidase [Poseidonocella pacifica]